MMKINKFALVIIILSICLCCNFVIIIQVFSAIGDNYSQMSKGEVSRMKKYEIMYILSANLNEEERTALQEKLHAY